MMSTVFAEKALQPDVSPTAHQPPPVVEVPVLLETRLLAALEQEARARGLSTGALVRRLIHGFLASAAAARRQG